MTAGDRGTALGIGDRVRRGLVLGWRATGRGVIEFYHSNNLTFASSIAYYSLLSVFPFILMVLTVLFLFEVVFPWANATWNLSGEATV